MRWREHWKMQGLKLMTRIFRALENITALLFAVATFLFAIFLVVMLVAMFGSMGCWVYYGTAAHDTAWLFKHCG